MTNGTSTPPNETVDPHLLQGERWAADAARFVLDESLCPRCLAEWLDSSWCPNCGADLSGETGYELRAASARLVDDLQRRQSVIARIPLRASRPPVASPLASPLASPEAAMDAPATVAPTLTTIFGPPTAPAEGSRVSIQSVLAMAGAGLLAVAAMVFTFLNPDLTSFAIRTVIVGVISVAFLGGAWLLAARSLRMSAETVGALGMLFLALDIWALSTAAPLGAGGFGTAAIATLGCASVVIALGARRGIRVWLWTGLLGLALVPAFAGYGIGSAWAATIGHLVAGFVAVGLHLLIRRVSGAFDSALNAEHATATTVQIVAEVLVSVQLLQLLATGQATGLTASAALVALAAASALGAQVSATAFWSWTTGALAALAVAVLPLAFWPEGLDSVWLFALIPTATMVGIVAISLLPALGRVRAGLLVGGAWAVTLTVAFPASLLAVVVVVEPFSTPDTGMVATLALVCTAAGSCGASLLSRARGMRHARVVGLWFAAGAVLSFVAQPGYAPTLRAALGVAFALGLVAILVTLPAVARWTARLRAPLVAGAHALLLYGAVTSWVTLQSGISVGIAIVASVVALSFTVSRRLRPVYVGVAYVYALAVFAAALQAANVDLIATVCLTTSLASLGAIAATFTKRLSIGVWYAVLLATMVPFLVGVVSVLFVRSGWTGLSTGLIFLLALTIVATTRPGLTRALRGFAAALLIPSLSVVVICLGAEWLAMSASPVTLPLIAAIVAGTVPSTTLIRNRLERAGIPGEDADEVRLWIEVSALVTAVLAVLLAVMRAAAGAETAFLVLLILGAGAAATAVVTRRAYAWWAAGASWTGALWSVWAMAGVDLVELYLVPPALAAAVVGAVFVGRRRPGVLLYVCGLAGAIVPSLWLLTLSRPGSSDAPWRALALLAAAAVLCAAGVVLTSRPRTRQLVRLSPLRTATLGAAVVAASAGAIQGIRYGWLFDWLALPPELLMAPALAFALAAAVIAAVAGRRLASFIRSRWLVAPAAVYLVVGPIAAVRLGVLPILALGVLSVLLLALMLITVTRAARAATSLPPVWFTFLLAWVTAVAAWSERALRVESFSIPLGLALLAAGALAMRDARRPDTRPTGTLTSWPIGHRGSWRLLAPGIVVTLLPSMLATATDPLTWRAILVIVLALTAVLVGSTRKLAAPFILGVVALPIENAIVFVVQIGHAIGALPWWITLATAGAVLLVIAVGSEQRSSGIRGAGARLRDLR